MLPTKLQVPIKASDRLSETLMLDDDDIEIDLVEIIAQRTNRSLDNCEDNPYFGKVTTVEHLVLFFNYQKVISG